MFSSLRVGGDPGCRRQSDALLIHSFGLRAHDEAEEVLVWYSGSSDGGRGATLIVQARAL